MIPEESSIVDDERIRAQELLRAFELDLRHEFSTFGLSPEEIFASLSIDDVGKKFELRGQNVSVEEILENLSFGELVQIVLRNQDHFSLDSSMASLFSQSKDLEKLVTLRNILSHHRDHDLQVSDLDFMFNAVRAMIVEGFDGKRSKEQLLRTARVLQTRSDRQDVDNTLHNLPDQDYSDTGFIGRQEILLKIMALLKKEPGASGTFTWLIGPGGVGKSALALEVANRLKYSGKFELIHWASFKTGEFTNSGVRPLVDSLQNVSDIPGAIVQTISGSKENQSLRDIWSALSGIPTLLILDNCESLEATQFMALSESEPPLNIRFLLTSRTHGAIGVAHRVTDFTEDECRKFLGKMGRVFESQVLLDIAKSDDSLRNLINATGRTPLAIKWVAKRCVKGDNLEDILNSQGSLFDYCVGAGYREISPVSRKLVDTMHESKDWMSTSDMIPLVEVPIETLQEALRELNDRMFLDQKSGDGITTCYRLNETVENFMVHSLEVDALKGVQIRRRIRSLRERGSQNQTAQMTKGYFSPYFVDRSSDEQNVVAARLFEAIGPKRLSLSEIREQLKILRNIQEVAPKYWEVYRVQGHLLSWLGQDSDAEDFLLQAIELAPEGRPTARCLCFLADIVGDSDDVEALSYVRKAYDESPEWYTNLKLCRFLYRSGNIDEAIEKLEILYRESTADYDRYCCAYELSRAFQRGAQIKIDSPESAQIVKLYAQKGLKNLLQCYEFRFMKDQFGNWGRESRHLKFSASIPEVHLELLARFIKQIKSRDEYLVEKEFIDKVADALRAIGARSFTELVKEENLKFNKNVASKFVGVVGKDTISKNLQSFFSTATA